MDSERLSFLLGDLDDFSYVPGSFDKLRALIVELAMAGRLTERPPGGADAVGLLEKIQEHKEELEIKSYVPPSDEPFDIGVLPDGWTAAYLGDLLTHCRNGTSASPNNAGDGFPVLRISAATSRRDGWVDVTDVKHTVLSPDEAEPYAIQENDLLACRFNGNLHYVGRVAQVPAGFLNPTLHPDKLICLRTALMSTEFLRIAINSPVVRRQIESVATTTAGNIGINGKQLRALRVPVPSLEEQILIAKVVDDGLRLVDQLEERHQDAESLRGNFIRTTLIRVGQGEPTRDADALFDLVRTPADAQAFEGAVLDLALSGLLVPQIAEEGTADDLLREVREAEEAGGSKGRRQIRPRTASEPLAELPSSWTWVPLGDITTKIGSGSTPRGGRAVYTESGPLFLRSQNVWNDGLRLEDAARIPEAIHTQMSNTAVRPGDVLLNITGASIGRASLLQSDFGEEANVSQHVMIVRPALSELAPYLHLCLISPYFQRRITDTQVGISRAGLSKKTAENLLIPLPPLAEQARIVAVVASALRLIRRLEIRLAA